MKGWLVVAVVGLTAALGAQGGQPADSTEIEVLELRPNVYLVAGGGANVTVQLAVDGVVVVDAGSRASAGAVLAVIKKITGAPIPPQVWFARILRRPRPREPEQAPRLALRCRPAADHTSRGSFIAMPYRTLPPGFAGDSPRHSERSDARCGSSAGGGVGL